MVEKRVRKGLAYVAIADEIRTWILEEKYRPGDRLPNERDLVEFFNAARMTVRHALEILQLEGYIERRRGRNGGTFVRPVPPKIELTQLKGILPQLEARGANVTTRVVYARLVKAPAHIALSLNLMLDELVYYV
ncbi:GntR family transcriptional regulator [Corynebacterium caspium]|uniref:GntR family transcriptional regulator n=1 Tax=Corynebacterium caspium TaxID=234828 RepID=UPI00036F2777|nr:GntR family transcriptional regulator [Corynebacterium caspium]